MGEIAVGGIVCDFTVERYHPVGGASTTRAVVRAHRNPAYENDVLINHSYERRFPDTAAGRTEAMAWAERTMIEAEKELRV